MASQIGSGLTGVLYVLDEPSIGLHQRDNKKLITALKKLRDLGNTVIVVEHDIETMENADHIVDIGPEAGSNGGEIIAQGEIKNIIEENNSITGSYLSGKKFISTPKKRRIAKNGRYLEINGATGNNLKNVNLKIPIGTFSCITGVSGSGKSTLILHTLYNALNLILNNNKSRKLPKSFKNYKGTELIDKIIDIDQSLLAEHLDQIPQLILEHLDQYVIGLQIYLSLKLEVTKLEDFHLMLKVEDVKLVKVMEF